MSPIVAALLGALAGLLLGAGLMVALLKRPDVESADTSFESRELRAMMEVFRSAVVIVGAHDEILERNGLAERLAIIRGTRIGIPEVLDLVRATRRDEAERALEVALADRTGRGSVQLAVRTLPVGGGRVFVVADDRTQVVRAAQASRDFLSNATHELKTPIGAIILLSEAVQDAADDPDAVGRFADKIEREAGRLSNLVQQIITLSKLHGQPDATGAEGVRVDAVVDEALARCREVAEGRRISLSSAGDRDLWLLGDVEQVTTALTNLVHNAVSYSNPGARVVVTSRAVAEDTGDWVELAVSDNGIGIAPADQERVFERFYRVDYARSRETGGTGLGLSIVREIAEGHGGSVSLWSRPGSGSTFTLRLPATVPEPDEEEAEA